MVMIVVVPMIMVMIVMMRVAGMRAGILRAFAVGADAAHVVMVADLRRAPILLVADDLPYNLAAIFENELFPPRGRARQQKHKSQ